MGFANNITKLTYVLPTELNLTSLKVTKYRKSRLCICRWVGGGGGGGVLGLEKSTNCGLAVTQL